MPQLEKAATAGVVVVVAIIGIIMYEAIRAGLPGITSGELPVFSMKVCNLVMRALVRAHIGFGHSWVGNSEQ